jgi:hypothetical protein
VKDLSHLPRAQEIEGLAPDADTTFVTVLVDELAKQPPKPKVSDTLSRHSSAASCLKREALLRDGVEPEPMDLAGLHVTNIGTMVHEAWQDALAHTYGDPYVQFEVPTTIEDLTSGSCDALLTLPDHPRHVLELKTTGGYGYKLMVGERGIAQGPKSSHMVQLALNVMGLDADKGTLVYLSNEAISAGAAEGKGFSEANRFGAQWTFTREQLQPLADEWLAQLAWVRDHPTDEVPRFVPHEMPKGARLNPETGTWTLEIDGEIVDTGSYWSKGAGCLFYCPVAEACRKRYAEGK